MRVFALELDNDIRGIAERKAYIEGLIARLPEPELVLLPELSLSAFISTVTGKVPASVGVPEMVPSSARVMPAGRAPFFSV